MSLLAIKSYLQRNKVVTLQSLCRLFRLDQDRMRLMLRHFINKGMLRVCERKKACESPCFKCPTSENEFYEWIACVS